MQVKEICSRVTDLSGVKDNKKVLAWVNAAYYEVLDALGPHNPSFPAPAKNLNRRMGDKCISLPPAHHHILVWGAMVWSSLFERGFPSESEMVCYQRNWAQAKERLKLALMATPPAAATTTNEKPNV